MKKFFLHIVFVLISLGGYSQTVATIPDLAFLSFLKSYKPTLFNNNDELILSQAALVTGTITCPAGSGITNLEGIQHFTQIKKISAIHNNITSIPSLLPITNLETVHIYDNKLTTVPDFTGLTKLKTVLIYQNQLTQLPGFGNNPIIEEIIANNNSIKILQDLSAIPSLLKLDVGENQLTALPDLSKNVNLQELICWSNQITVLPDLTKLTKLTRLNAGKNKLTQTPDLRKNTQLTTLALDNNLLTVGPDLSAMTGGFSNVKLYNNFLSFEDLLPYTSISYFPDSFDISPMNTFKMKPIEAYSNETVYASTGIDQSVSGVSYKFLETASSLATTVSNDSVAIKESGGGVSYRYIYAELSHPSIPGLILKTDSIAVHFNACPKSSDVTYKATKTDCSNSGTVKIEVHGYVASNTTYQLRSLSQGWMEKYSSNYITGLIDTAYALQINFSPGCILDYTKNIEMPYVDCKEVFITPNNDGDMDTYFMTGTGSAVIYDKNGKEVKRVSLPYEWNGYGPNGLVPPGYYIVVVNGGKDKIYISVLY